MPDPRLQEEIGKLTVRDGVWTKAAPRSESFILQNSKATDFLNYWTLNFDLSFLSDSASIAEASLYIFLAAANTDSQSMPSLSLEVFDGTKKFAEGCQASCSADTNGVTCFKCSPNMAAVGQAPCVAPVCDGDKIGDGSFKGSDTKLFVKLDLTASHVRTFVGAGKGLMPLTVVMPRQRSSPLDGASLQTLMCGRTRQTLGEEQVLHAAGARRWVDRQQYQPSYNAAPGFPAPVVRAEGDETVVHTMRWGLVPSFTKLNDKPDYWRMFNARSESLAEKPSFRRLVPSKRCLGPQCCEEVKKPSPASFFKPRSSAAGAKAAAQQDAGTSKEQGAAEVKAEPGLKEEEGAAGAATEVVAAEPASASAAMVKQEQEGEQRLQQDAEGGAGPEQQQQGGAAAAAVNADEQPREHQAAGTAAAVGEQATDAAPASPVPPQPQQGQQQGTPQKRRQPGSGGGKASGGGKGGSAKKAKLPGQKDITQFFKK
ncbi:hypothetical protein CHLNCDRAFT_139906 [Chlorella variabilis]|uniref:Uncharacterized protein n=1 Tax=Chlorella variabilis TaxID=554065 RepID=E1ZR63_CHLVA|nr:hypothetical protein CHLNCDRAFT_139906 [Chlorella variabilis]EFN51676.1 hypothetical protein CHLNCDRAFT_139906 [Chlorella variabilis]|eukprot:XP_005843778.1 hypothetical protein CHLNCDRAFT_139906 [Chlorella variabilis]